MTDVPVKFPIMENKWKPRAWLLFFWCQIPGEISSRRVEQSLESRRRNAAAAGNAWEERLVRLGVVFEYLVQLALERAGCSTCHEELRSIGQKCCGLYCHDCH